MVIYTVRLIKICKTPFASKGKLVINRWFCCLCCKQRGLKCVFLLPSYSFVHIFRWLIQVWMRKPYIYICTQVQQSNKGPLCVQ